MNTQVAYIVCGHSEFDPNVWRWLNDNQSVFGEGNLLLSSFDHILAWGLLGLAGCTVKSLGDDEDPRPDRPTYGNEVQIHFNGTIDELIRRLDELTSQGEE